MRNRNLGLTTLGIVLLIVLLLLLIGAWPMWPHQGFGLGYGAPGLVTILLVVVVVLLLTGPL